MEKTKSEKALIKRLQLAEAVIEETRRYLTGRVSERSEVPMFDAYEQYSKAYGPTWKKRRWGLR